MGNRLRSHFLNGCRMGLTAMAIGQLAIGPVLADDHSSSNDHGTRTPIKHVIVIIGENRSFDHVFATYVPKQRGQTINNLLSEGIISLDGNKDAVGGPNFKKAQQLAAQDPGTQDTFLLSPPTQSFPNGYLPAPLVGGPKTPYVSTVASAKQTESGLASDYYQYLTTGGTGQTSVTPDQRIANVNQLPAGPFQLTSTTMPYDAYTASPVHRFYQMWQQLNCSIGAASRDNPSGCGGNLFAWVEVTVGAGTNGATQPANFSTEYSAGATVTGEGSSALGFYNVQKGDVPYLTSLADKYAMSDNYHQAASGGTGANHIMLGHADMIWFSDASGKSAVPPTNVQVFSGTPDQGIVNQVENPNPAPNTNNWYTEDGYGGGGYGSPVSGGGSYTNCSDLSQPGVKPVVDYLQSLPRKIEPNCEAGRYYLLNNYNPGWFGNGKNAYIDNNPANTPFTVPPSSTPSIGDSLNAKNISWKYYGDQWNNYVNDPYQLNWGANGPNADEYCNICNPFQYDTSIMSHPDQVAAHIQDSVNLYSDISKHTLPAVSFVKPSGYTDGHPASSKLDLFEGFVKKIVDQVEASEYAKDTAIFITFDEGGGYYDSGYVQPVDFFGDGTRVPMIIVSPYVKPAYISHEYADHVSIVKFIERNWNLQPITNRSRDNLPNPVTDQANLYVPVNSPAIGDMFDFFDFVQAGDNQHGGWNH
jgi:phospholipase C